MPINLPNLDDRTYADLVKEGRALIPALAPQWTNHNESDPGITLLELFAFLTEMLLYRANRITDRHLVAYLKLLNGPEWEPGADLQAEKRAAVLRLRSYNRAVTTEDFEHLALAADANVARAKCFVNTNLDSKSDQAFAENRPGHISVMIVPKTGADGLPAPDSTLIQAVLDTLEPRRLLTTQVHVVGPKYWPVKIQFQLAPRSDALPQDVRDRAAQAVQAYFDPLSGGPDGSGWPFGRDVYLSEIYALLDRVPGVDYVEAIPGQAELDAGDPDRLILNANKELVAVDIYPDELVRAQVSLAVRATTNKGG